MSSSPQKPTDRVRDLADGWSTAAAWALILTLSGAAAYFGGHRDWRPDSGEIQLCPEMVLRVAPAPMPAMTPPRREPVAEPPPEIVPEPEPEPEPLPELVPEPVVEPEPQSRPPPDNESAPSVAVQAPIEEEGNAGAAAAIRSEWLKELRRRIEESKYYPSAARYSREMGTVLLRVEIGADGEIGPAEILENTGSALLLKGARGILRRAAVKPLGTNALGTGFRVDVPITYRVETR